MNHKSTEQKIWEIMEVRDDLCNEWEHGFIGSMVEQIDQSDPRPITEKQREVIDELYEKSCDSPY